MKPEQFGRYRLDELIGRGGSGEVYRAVDTAGHRTVALKRLASDLATDAVYQARFRREARITAGLASPHVVPIHDYGQIDGRLFLVMPLIDGIDAADLLVRHGPLPPERAVDIVGQAAQALDAAHAAGLVHRDVKPSNLLVTRGDFVHLVDFGIAHRVGATTALTATGRAIGTLDYMAPECFETRGDHRVDVYALACVLYELLTARRPFPAEVAAALMYAHLRRPPPRPSSVRAGLPAALDAVVARGMAKDPQQRFATAGELAAAAWDALRPALPGPVHPAAQSRPPHVRRRRSQTVLLVVVALLIMLGALITLGALATVAGAPQDAGVGEVPAVDVPAGGEEPPENPLE